MFDQNADGRVCVKEAALGIRSLAEVHLDAAEEARLLSKKRPRRNCELALADLDDQPFILDCLASSARDRIANNEDPLAPFDITSALGELLGSFNMISGVLEAPPAARGKVSAPTSTANSDEAGIHVLISSDWHGEPWYDISNEAGAHTSDSDPRVSRYN